MEKNVENNLYQTKKKMYFENEKNFCDIAATLQNSQNLRKNCKFRRKSLRDKCSTQFIRHLEYKILPSIYIHAYLIKLET